jgi:hypothetical protein
VTLSRPGVELTKDLLARIDQLDGQFPFIAPSLAA